MDSFVQKTDAAPLEVIWLVLLLARCTDTCYLHAFLTAEALVSSFFKELSSEGRLQ